MKFRTTLELAGKTATGLRVPEEVVTSLGNGKRPPVTVTINGYTYRSTIAPYSGAYMLPVSAENRERAGIAAGDDLDVEVTLDLEPRKIDVPGDLANALANDAGAKAFFEGLSFSKQRWFVDGLASAKKPETRLARLEKFVTMLREHTSP